MDEDSYRNIEDALHTIESHFAVALGEAATVEAACGTLQREFDRCSDSHVILQSHQALLPLLSQRRGPVANILYRFLEDEVGRRADYIEILVGMLQARQDSLRLHTVELVARLVSENKITPAMPLIIALAGIVEEEKSPLREKQVLLQIAQVMRRLPDKELPGGGKDPLERLFLAGSPSVVRCLAARVLDATDEKLPPERVSRAMGAEAADFLAPYLEYTRATHLDIVDIVPELGTPPPALPSLVQAQRMLGKQLLGSVIAELGWARLAWGLTVMPAAARSFSGSFPFVLRAAEAAMLETVSPCRKLWDRFLVIAHGGTPEDTGKAAATDTVHRFRRYNVAHAEALNQFLEVAPLTPERVRSLLDRMDRIVEDFLALFGPGSDEAPRLPAVYGKIRSRIEECLENAQGQDWLSSDVTRLVEMFEDPHNLDEVRTLHGLKRYLHQRGLLYAFRLFRSGGTTNRTVDLVLTSSRRPLQTLRSITYLDFEPDPYRDATELPFAVQIAVQAFARHLLHGRQSFPFVQILRYGNEVQIYIGFRNHPAFLRIDFSPPLRGGMIDLEYFAVSQYEMDQHPDLSLQGIQRLFRKMEFDVQKDGFRLHARYDRERAFDYGDITDKAQSLFSMVPYLMDFDWAIASLDYPEPVRRVVADAWAEFLLAWGVLPGDEALTADKRKILKGRIQGPAGEQEIAWDGRGPYHDLFSGTPPFDLLDVFRKELVSRGLGAVVQWLPAQGLRSAQLPLERCLLIPLREALLRGEIAETPRGLQPAPAETFLRDHEADRFARILSAGGERLRKAACLGSLAGTLDRHLQFQTTGSLQGYPVQRATLHIRGERIGLFMLRNRDGNVALALAAGDGVLYRIRSSAADPWTDHGEPDELELARHLRRDNYLAPGYELERVSDETVERLSSEFLAPNPRSSPAAVSGEKMVAGVAASPGRAAGVARFGDPGRKPSDFEGTIYIAPAIRPEDAPFIGRSAGVVSTGGGILSHAGMVALELQKPAVIIPGRWVVDRGGRTVLRYRLPVYTQETSRVEGYEVVRRLSYSEHEEDLQEGDVVVLNAEDATLTVLGQDRDTLGFQQELRQLKEAAVLLESSQDERELLVVRGRLMRSAHQLEKLLQRMEKPALARHAVHELLLPADGSAGTGLADRGHLLRTLFSNASCGTTAREIAARAAMQLARRHDALCRGVLAAIPSARNLFEPLFLRLQLLEIRGLLREVNSLLRECDIAAPAVEETDVDRPVRQRLTELLGAMERRAGTEPGWVKEQLERHASLIRDALGVERAPAAGALRAPGCLSKNSILTADDGGIELRQLIGAKAAHLGQVSRILGAERVPPWFAVTDAAFRAVLSSNAGQAAGEAGLEGGGDRTIEQAIEEFISQPNLDPARKSASIQHLWKNARLPDSLREEIIRAYRSLGTETEPPLVAVRSSAFEEDTERNAFPGQFDTFLFVQGEQSLLEHLKLAWAGLWSERAIQMRNLLGDTGNAYGGGVIIQKAIQSRVSGVLLTVSPAIGQLGEMTINAGLGLGEGVVSGVVEVDHIQVTKTPDMESPLQCRYRVGDKREQIVFDTKAGHGTRKVECVYHQRFRPALEYAELCDLVQVAAGLERAFNQPLDMEFSIEDHNLYVLQVRPIAVFHSALRDTLLKHPLEDSQ